MSAHRQRLSLRLDAIDVPRAERLLELAGAEAVALADAGDDPVLEPAPETAPLWSQVRVTALFPAHYDLAALARVLETACNASAPRVDELRDAEWQRAIRQVFSARAVGERVWLAPADETAAPSGRALVRLHMGLAFGTGEHPTTALCLDWLDANIEGGELLVDYGCGSGVLALTALALGAEHAWAVDNDPQAISATAANAALNDASSRLFVGAPEALPAAARDIVIANILAAPLIALASTLASRVRPGGSLVLSGVLEAQGRAVTQAYAPWFEPFTQEARDGWLCLVAKRSLS